MRSGEVEQMMDQSSMSDVVLYGEYYSRLFQLDT